MGLFLLLAPPQNNSQDVKRFLLMFVSNNRLIHSFYVTMN